MKEFEMKDLRKTKFCLRLQIEHLRGEILVHQSNYIEKGSKKILYGQSSSDEVSNDGAIIKTKR